MSHLRERKDKNCLNCGTLVQGKYCHVCGQENIEPKESFWHLVLHFFNDITHFDGKFFHSLKYVLFRPGKLPLEYLKGRRASYLNPIRMYVFTSAIFFLIFFSLKDITRTKDRIIDINGKTFNQINEMDSATFASFTLSLNKELGINIPMTRGEFRHYGDSIEHRGIHFTNRHFKSKEEYDSLRRVKAVNHNWIQRKMIYREIEMNAKYDNNARQIISSLQQKFIHTFPQIIWVSLPLFALVLKLLYRRRKEYYYVNHAIFSIYHYIFVFLLFTVLLGIGQLHDWLHWGIFNYIYLLLNFGLFVYLYAGMYNFYKQGAFVTFLKFLLLNIMSALVVVILFAGFLLFSLFEI
jgi:hypothetical protein